jgi:diguanylate cyclase (GGDEF)-like protein
MAILAMAAMLTGVGLLRASEAVDRISLDAQTWEPYRAIGRGLDSLALAQETVGICDVCEAKASGPNPDIEWIDRNIGRKLAYLYRAHEVYVLNDADDPVYALVRGAQIAPEKFAEVEPAIMYFADLVRGRTVRANGFSDRLPGQPVAPFTAVTTSTTAIHATEVARVRGELALVSVFRMRSAAPIQESETRPPLLVAVRYLDAAFLALAASQNMLIEPRISDDAVVAEGEVAMPLMNMEQQTLGYFVHKPIVPGTYLIDALLPMAIAGMLIVAAMLLTLSLKLRSMMKVEHRQIDELHQAHTELSAKEAQAHHLAYHDVLTGLPNRGLFTNEADKALVLAKRDRPVGILLLDLDRFKFINDRFGHLAGDALIREVADRLTEIVKPPSTVSRLGGDEFAVILHPDDLVDGPEAILEEIKAALRQPFDLFGNQAHVGVSIGVAMAPECGIDRTELMRKADIALYQAKDAGRDCHRFFTDAMDESVQLRAMIEADLRRASMTFEEFEVVYQPQICTKTNMMVGCEALLRWNHPIHGLVMPQIFIPIAEEAGLISALGDWVVADACRLAKQRPDLSIAVNLSPAQFLEEGYAERLSADVRRMGVKESQIELEVTEGVLLDDSDKVRGAVRSMRECGFRIALDDFGTGYSSLSYLRKFEVDKIKIDKSFVQSLGHSEDADAIVTAVVTLAHAMGLAITAEGVEETQQEKFLRAAGCTELQGFLFSEGASSREILSGAFDRAKPSKKADSKSRADDISGENRRIAA